VEITEDELMRLCSIRSSLDIELGDYKSMINNTECSKDLLKLKKKSLNDAYEIFKKNFSENAVKIYPYKTSIEHYLK